jgi:hypothetical protein
MAAEDHDVTSLDGADHAQRVDPLASGIDDFWDLAGFDRTARTWGLVIGAIGVVAVVTGWLGHSRWWWFGGLAAILLAASGLLRRRSDLRRRLFLGGLALLAVVATVVAVKVGHRPAHDRYRVDRESVVAGGRSVAPAPGGSVLDAGEGPRTVKVSGTPTLVPAGPIAALIDHTAVRTDGTVAWTRTFKFAVAASDDGIVVLFDEDGDLTAVDPLGKVTWTRAAGSVIDSWGNRVDSVLPTYPIVVPPDSGPSEILDPRTGDVLARVDRAEAESIVAAGDRVVWADRCRIGVWDAAEGARRFTVDVNSCSFDQVRLDGRVLYLDVLDVTTRVDLDTQKVERFPDSDDRSISATEAGLVAWTDSAVSLIDPATGVDRWTRTISAIRSVSLGDVIKVFSSSPRPGPFGGRVDETRTLDLTNGHER